MAKQVAQVPSEAVARLKSDAAAIIAEVGTAAGRQSAIAAKDVEAATKFIAKIPAAIRKQALDKKREFDFIIIMELSRENFKGGDRRGTEVIFTADNLVGVAAIVFQACRQAELRPYVNEWFQEIGGDMVGICVGLPLADEAGDGEAQVPSLPDDVLATLKRGASEAMDVATDPGKLQRIEDEKHTAAAQTIVARIPDMIRRQSIDKETRDRDFIVVIELGRDNFKRGNPVNPTPWTDKNLVGLAAVVFKACQTAGLKPYVHKWWQFVGGDKYGLCIPKAPVA